jgi:hypothetical protein
MKTKLLLVGAIFTSFVASCVPEANYEPYEEREISFDIEHTYELQVVDINDTPLPEATVNFHVEEPFEDGMHTDSEGKVLEKVFLKKSARKFTSSVDCSTCFNYEVTKEGYFPKTGLILCHSYYLDLLKANTVKTEIKSEKVTLIQPSDYFMPTFLSSTTGTELKHKIIPLLENRSSGLGKSLVLETLDSCMQTRSIDLIEFKNKNYLKIGFVSTNVYNSLRLTKYDVGKTLFDEVIRKILAPLNSYISDPNQFYGYDINITGFTKAFTNETWPTIIIKYRFIMPQEAIKRYEDKDISGQDLLNQSIILMDDQRIELRLQGN